MFVQIGEKSPEPFDWVHKVAEVITAFVPFSWPALILVIAIIYRDPISDFIRRMKHFEAPGVKGDTVEAKLENIEDKALNASKPLPEKPEGVDHSRSVLPVASDPNPFETVLKAWGQVEEQLEKLAEISGLPRTATFNIISMLSRNRLIDRDTFEALRELREFRNTVVHKPNEVDLTVDQAVRYAESANIVAVNLSIISSLPKHTSE